MRNKGLALFWVDVANAIAFAGMLVTGVVLKWILPHGPNGGGRGRASSAAWMGFSRHEWGEVHFWISLVVVALLCLHLALHVGWILASMRKCLPNWKKPAVKATSMSLVANA